MLACFAEDFKPGDVYELGKYRLTKKEIVEFAKKYDPFPFHIDDKAAQSTVFGGIISSGWLTALVWLRLMHEKFISYETTLGSPGHEEMLWPTPVRPDDYLSGQVKILATRISKSKPDLGFVRYKAIMCNQDGQEVFITTSTILVKPRPTGAAN